MANRSRVKPTVSWSIQWPETSRTRATPMSLGTKLSVISCTCVTAWTRDTAKPIPSATSRIGNPSLALSSMACRPMWTTSESVMAPSVVALDEGGGDHAPAADHDEQQQLEGQRDQRGRQHHHAHRHQGR